MRTVFFVIVSIILLLGCRAPQSDAVPAIEFSKIPPADEGGADRTETIEGRVAGARPGQQIVLFARSGMWWIQPHVDKPFTEVQADSTWKNSTHLGTEYAALLVEPDYRPPLQTDVLPAVGNGVIAAASVKGAGEIQTSSDAIKFSGYEWKIRSRKSDRGGTATEFDPKNVWTDDKGFLHLRVSKSGDGWKCAEIFLPRSLGYGTYAFTTQNLSNLEPSTVFSVYTWDVLEAGQNHREMNVEFTRWGDPANKNMQYVVQPYYLPANVAKFAIPAEKLTHSIQWKPGSVEFKTVRGTKFDERAEAVAQHQFTSGVPDSEGETLRINLYVFGYAKVPQQKEAEVVVEKFEYLP